MCAYLFVYIGWTSVYLYVMAPLALYLDEDVQLKVLVPNLLVGAANVDMGAETALDTQLRFLLIHSLRLSCKSWKMIVDKSAEYNALRLAQYEYAWVPMLSQGFVCHANITSSLNSNKT